MHQLTCVVNNLVVQYGNFFATLNIACQAYSYVCVHILFITSSFVCMHHILSQNDKHPTNGDIIVPPGGGTYFTDDSM